MKKNLQAILLCLVLLIPVANNAQNAPYIQAVHCIADPGLEYVDIYASALGVQLVPPFTDLSFRSATDTINTLIAGFTATLGLAHSGSTGLNDVIKSIDIALEYDKIYLGVGAGVENPNDFAPNPEGKDTGLDLFFIDNARHTVSTTGNVEFVIAHCVTDAPTVDVRVQGGAVLADNLAYGELSSYLSVAPDLYTLEITDAAGVNVIETFTADLSTFANKTLIVYASGFLNPAQNQNGQSLGLGAAAVDGTEVDFPKVTVGIDDDNANGVNSYELAQNYPNPFNPTTQISYRLPASSDVVLTVYNLVGQAVKTLVSTRQAAGNYTVEWDGTNQVGAPVTSGVYLYQLQTPEFSQTRKMMLIK